MLTFGASGYKDYALGSGNQKMIHRGLKASLFKRSLGSDPSLPVIPFE